MIFSKNIWRSSTSEKSTRNLIYFSSLLFLALNLFLITKDIYFLSLLPVVVFILYLYFVSLDTVFFITIALTPLSLQLVSEEYNLGLNLPSEPLLFGILILFFFKILLDRPLTKQFISHPVSIFILLQLMWLAITSLTSQLPLVSGKYFLMQLWFIIPVYFYGSLVLNTKRKIFTFIILLTIGTVITVIYTTINHAMQGFGEREGHWVMQPFYNDHTAYGAFLAMIIPVILGIVFRSKLSRFTKIYLFIGACIIFLGIFLSFSRATWMSLAAAFVFYIVLVFQIKIKYILLSLVFAAGLFYMNYDTIIMKLEKNRQDSSKDFVEHVQSITNISTDASNLERINRWKAALRMFEEYPFFGTGPGTYQFMYAPFQKSKDKTIISTNAGNLGNAHSEYIGPLCERGVFGLLFFLGIIVSVFISGIKAYRQIADKDLKIILAVSMTGLFSYLIHGFLNNFLDTDNASILFWGLIVIIVKISMFSKYSNRKTEEIESRETI